MYERRSCSVAQNDVIAVSEVSAQVKPPDLTHHTVKRIVQTIKPFQSLPFERQSLVLFSKWGCNGSTS
jgi:hypothetical protein